jgi:hypothetical protein
LLLFFKVKITIDLEQELNISALIPFNKVIYISELLRQAHRQSKSGAKRVKKNMNNHDENWFNSRDNKYWSASRVACFWLTMLSMVASIVTAGILIAL